MVTMTFTNWDWRNEPPPTPDGYEPIAIPGEHLGIVLARIWQCTVCGASVIGTERHTAWHGEQ